MASLRFTMHHVTLQEAQTHLSDLFQSVLHGEEIVVMDREQPVVKMLPLTKHRDHPVFGSAKGKIRMADDFNETPPDFVDYH